MKNALGRGLASLLDGDEDVSQTLINLDLIDPNQYQPRKFFDEESIQSLAKSIEEKGLIQPVVVREKLDGRFELIVGERRLRAAKIADIKEIPALIRNISDKDSLEVAILENIQREELNPIDEAEGYMRLIHEFGHTQEDVAKFTGKSRSYVANFMRLLNLPEFSKNMLATNKISVGHAKLILSSNDPDSVTRKIISENLTVRQTEKEMKRDALYSQKSAGRSLPRNIPNEEQSSTDTDVVAIQEKIASLLKTVVKVNVKDDDSGFIMVNFKDLYQLDYILKILTGSGV